MNTIEISTASGRTLFVHTQEGNTAAITVRRAATLGYSLYGAHISEQDFSFSDLSGLDLSYIEFSDCSFYCANLRHCKMRHTQFSNCSLYATDLSFADIKYARFKGTDFGCNGFCPRFSAMRLCEMAGAVLKSLAETLTLTRW